MKIVKIYGGLGNQMFQYAFAASLAVACGEPVYADSSELGGDKLHNGLELEQVFGITMPEAPEAETRRLADAPTGILGRMRRKYLTKSTHRIDRKFGYQPELLSLRGDAYYEGYWQSEKYFMGREPEIRKAFRFKEPIGERNEELLSSLPRPIVSVHVRRGDYLAHPNLDICGPGYYEGAAAAIAARGGAGSFLVLSDDAEYCRKALRLGDAPVAYADWNRGPDSWRDMAMMARCDMHIIANSSFSWWGAWLDPNPGKLVVAPSIWNRREIEDRDRYYSFSFADVVPGSWLRVQV